MNFHRCFLKVDHKDVLTILPVVVEVQSRGNGFTKMLGSVNGTPLQYSCLENPWMWAAVHGVAKSQTWLSDFTFILLFHALEKEMATHSSVLAWRIPGMGEPGGLPSMGSHRVGHDWSDLAAAAAAADSEFIPVKCLEQFLGHTEHSRNISDCYNYYLFQVICGQVCCWFQHRVGAR